VLQQQQLLLWVRQHAELWRAWQEALSTTKAVCRVLQQGWVCVVLLLLGPAMHEGIPHELMLADCQGL
jgi:hypothetical protein